MHEKGGKPKAQDSVGQGRRDFLNGSGVVAGGLAAATVAGASTAKGIIFAADSPDKRLTLQAVGRRTEIAAPQRGNPGNLGLDHTCRNIRGDAMRRTFIFVSLVLILLAPLGREPLAQDLFAYPNQGQSQEQQEQDQFQCYNWAKQQSSFDPMAVPTASAPPPQEQSTGPGALGGAAVGGAGGAIVGAIAGDAGKGAGIGAVAGGLFGGIRSRNQTQQNQQARGDWERQQSAQYQQGRNDYNRAYAACLSARGYTVN